MDLMYVFKLDFTNTFIEIDNDEISKYDFMKIGSQNLKMKENK